MSTLVKLLEAELQEFAPDLNIEHCKVDSGPIVTMTCSVDDEDDFEDLVNALEETTFSVGGWINTNNKLISIHQIEYPVETNIFKAVFYFRPFP